MKIVRRTDGYYVVDQAGQALAGPFPGMVEAQTYIDTQAQATAREQARPAAAQPGALGFSATAPAAAPTTPQDAARFGMVWDDDKEAYVPAPGISDAELKRWVDAGIVTADEARQAFIDRHPEYTGKVLEYELGRAFGGGGEKSVAQKRAEKLAAEQALAAEANAAVEAYRQTRPGSTFVQDTDGNWIEEYTDESGTRSRRSLGFDPATGVLKFSGGVPQNTALQLEPGGTTAVVGPVAPEYVARARELFTPNELAALRPQGQAAIIDALAERLGRAPNFNEVSAIYPTGVSRDVDPIYARNLEISNLFPGRTYEEAVRFNTTEKPDAFGATPEMRALTPEQMRNINALELKLPGQAGGTPLTEEEKLRLKYFGAGGVPGARSTTSFRVNPETGQFEGQPVANQYSQSSRMNPETGEFEALTPGADTDLQTLQLMENPQQRAELASGRLDMTPGERLASSFGDLEGIYEAIGRRAPARSSFYNRRRSQRPFWGYGEEEERKPWWLGSGGQVAAGLSPSKARLMLHEGVANGRSISDRQRRYFGAVASGTARMAGGGEVLALDNPVAGFEIDRATGQPVRSQPDFVMGENGPEMATVEPLRPQEPYRGVVNASDPPILANIVAMLEGRTRRQRKQRGLYRPAPVGSTQMAG